jgi:hypothetical protein
MTADGISKCSNQPVTVVQPLEMLRNRELLWPEWSENGNILVGA